MSRFKYKFTLHQAYAHFARNGNLNWREVAESASVSTRTLRNYFENTEELSEILVDYHIKYMANFYEKYAPNPADYDEFPFKQIFYGMIRHKVVYLFTDKAFKQNLIGRGDEIKKLHRDFIAKTMTRGGSNPDKVDP